MATPNYQRRRITVELGETESILLDELVPLEDAVIGTRQNGAGNKGPTIRRAIRVLAVQQLGKNKVYDLVGGIGLRGSRDSEDV